MPGSTEKGDMTIIAETVGQSYYCQYSHSRSQGPQIEAPFIALFYKYIFNIMIIVIIKT